jgi:hypothetical protein
MRYDLTPYGGNGPTRLPKPIQQALAQQDHQALATAGRIRNEVNLAKLAIFEVASLAQLEGELIRQTPWAERHLEYIVATTASVIASEIGRYGFRV